MWRLGLVKHSSKQVAIMTIYLEGFLQWCDKKNLELKFNDRKFKLRMQEVPFIGHLATVDGMSIDPPKV